MNSNDIAKQFFTLEDTSLLEDKDNLLELQRRVKAFSNALSGFDGLHDVFSKAYEDTLYSVEKKKSYKESGAKGFISELLYGHSKKFLTKFNQKEKEQVISQIHKQIPENGTIELNEIKNDIKSHLFHMLELGYPQVNINEKGILHEVRNLKGILELADVRNIHNYSPLYYETRDFKENNIKLDEIIFDILVLRKKYLHSAHQLYIGDFHNTYGMRSLDWHWERYEKTAYKIEEGEFKGIVRKGDRNLDIEQFDKILLQLQNDFLKIQEVINEERKLLTFGVSIDQNDSFEKQLDRFTELLLHHQTKFKILSEDREHLSLSEEKEREPKIEYKELEDDIMDAYIKSLTYKCGDIYYHSDVLQLILERYKTLRGIHYFDKVYGKADHELIHQEKLKYGAKGSYLNALERFFKKVQKQIAVLDQEKENDIDTSRPYLKLSKEFSVPPYELVETERYKQRKETGKIGMQFVKEVYDRWKEYDKIIIRSSAVYSEDNDQNTGAGIYESIVLSNFKLRDVLFAIRKVYASCDTPGAITYRKKNNIPEEYMGLIVQKYEEGLQGQQNTILPNRPELSEVSYNNELQTRPIYKKEALEQFAFGGIGSDRFQEIGYHYNVDARRHSHDVVFFSDYFASLGEILERYFGKKLQIEFNYRKFKIERYDSEKKENYSYETDGADILQARPLPVQFIEPKYVEFPKDEKPLWEGDAIGVANEIMNVLATGADNSNNTGLVSFYCNYFASMSNFVQSTLPLDGAVVVRTNSRGRANLDHIETLCVEAGLVCLSANEKTKAPLKEEIGRDRQHGGEVTAHYTEFYGYEKVKVISDGLRGKIYGVEDVEVE